MTHFEEKAVTDIFKVGRLVEIKSKYDHGKYGVIIKVLSSSFKKQDEWEELCYMILIEDGTFCYASRSAVNKI